MARPTKSVSALSEYSQTKSEIKARKNAEEKLKGAGELNPPDWLTNEQQLIFRNIVDCLKESNMLAINDVWLLTKASIAIDRIEYIERKINESNGFLATDKDYIAVIKQYTTDFYRACNELCLSPQSRAKLANTATANIKKKPIEEIIMEASED